MTGQPRVRLVDVAAQLGVAPSTVSRALAGADAISQATRDRVLRVADELGYRANPAAAGLKQGVTFNLGLIASLRGSWYSSALAEGADAAAAGAGFDLVVATADEIEGSTGLLARAERLGQRVDGVIIVDVSAEGGLLDTLASLLAVPLVTVGCRHADWPSFQIDNQAVGVLAGQHLSSLGHRSLAALGLEKPNELTTDNTSERVAGFVAGASGCTVMRSVLSRRGPAARREEILRTTNHATAVFCTSDELAIEVIAVLGAVGRLAPSDVSVMSVDDHPLAEAVGLTTVGQDPMAVGRAAVLALLEQLNMPGPSTHQVVAADIVVRSTTAPLLDQGTH